MIPMQPLRQFEPAQKAFSLWEEFRSFAFKGNVIDLAVGVIIGAAFGRIVDSLVKNLIMPIIAVLVSFVVSDESTAGYKEWAWVINGKSIPVGEFLADVLNFFLVSAALFVFVVKFLGWVMKLRKEEIAAAPALTKDQVLLTEIRDLLKHDVAPPPA